MSENFILYTNPMSRGRTTRWALEEVGASYGARILNYEVEMKSPGYLKINPFGKVPALQHGDTVITESAAICAYLADIFPEAKLIPPVGSKARGLYYRWFFFAAGPLTEALTTKILGVTVPENLRRMVGSAGFDESLAVLETQLSQTPYLTGETFTIVDLYICSFLFWIIKAGKYAPSNPVFDAYMDKIMQRPAYLRAAAQDDALLQAGS